MKFSDRQLDVNGQISVDIHKNSGLPADPLALLMSVSDAVYRLLYARRSTVELFSRTLCAPSVRKASDIDRFV